jgi:hypothetical protein
VTTVTFDGIEQRGMAVPLIDDGADHRVVVALGDPGLPSAVTRRLGAG